MSLMDAPTALIDRILRRPPLVPADELAARMLERLAHDLEPDPLYRRRLRGEALNRFVAAREGIGMGRHRSRASRMTPIGRGVLLASFILAAGTASVSAVSQVALPGDALYGVKLQIEQLRVDVAPNDFKDGLVVASLDARLAEIQALAERGDWVTAIAVADAAVQIATTLEAMAPHTSPAAEITLNHHVAVLAAVLAEAPATAATALQGALDASASAASVVSEHGWRVPSGAGAPAHVAPAADAASSPEPTRTPRPGSDNEAGAAAPALDGSAPASGSGAQPGSDSGADGGPTDSGDTGDGSVRSDESGTDGASELPPPAASAGGSAPTSPAPVPAPAPAGSAPAPAPAGSAPGSDGQGS